MVIFIIIFTLKKSIGHSLVYQSWLAFAVLTIEKGEIYKVLLFKFNNTSVNTSRNRGRDEVVDLPCSMTF